MQVKDVMSRNVAAVDANTKVEDIAKIMKDMNIGSVPVCSGKRVLGIVTDRDIVLRGIATGKDTTRITAGDVMTTGIATVSPSEDIHRAAEIMSEKQIRRLPVVEENNLIGIVSIGDFAVKPKLSDEAGEALSDISKPTNTML